MVRWNGQEDWEEDDDDGCGMQWIPLAFILFWAVVLAAYVVGWILRF